MIATIKTPPPPPPPPRELVLQLNEQEADIIYLGLLDLRDIYPNNNTLNRMYNLLVDVKLRPDWGQGASPRIKRVLAKNE